MLLDESDIAAIVEHLGDTVQFYDANGLAGNVYVLAVIRDRLRSYVGTPSSKAAERFDLVKIVSEKRVECGGAGILDHPEIVAKQIVHFADAVLAAMEKADKAQDEDAKDRQAIRRAIAGTPPKPEAEANGEG